MNTRNDLYRHSGQTKNIKWEAVKCFQVNWDVNADDFAAMLTKALSQTGNLLASVNNFPAKMIIKFAEIAQEEVRAMFIELFDEGKDVYERVDSFKQKSNSLLERYGNGAAQHYQYENAIAPICGCVIRINITFINLQRSRQFLMSWKVIIRSKRVRMQITFVIFLLSIMKSVTS